MVTQITLRGSQCQGSADVRPCGAVKNLRVFATATKTNGIYDTYTYSVAVQQHRGFFFSGFPPLLPTSDTHASDEMALLVEAWPYSPLSRCCRDSGQTLRAFYCATEPDPLSYGVKRPSYALLAASGVPPRPIAATACTQRSETKRIPTHNTEEVTPPFSADHHRRPNGLLEKP